MYVYYIVITPFGVDNNTERCYNEDVVFDMVEGEMRRKHEKTDCDDVTCTDADIALGMRQG